MVSRQVVVVVVAVLAVFVGVVGLAAAEEATVKGVLEANGETVELPYVYVWAEEEGFFDPADPTWSLLFVDRPIEERELGEMLWEAAYVELKITKTAEFSDEPELHVYGPGYPSECVDAGQHLWRLVPGSGTEGGRARPVRRPCLSRRAAGVLR